MFWPSASTPLSVDAPVGNHVAAGDAVATVTSGRWLMLVFWLER